MSKEYHLTKAGAEELKTELESLKSRRSDIAQRLKAAKLEGDLSENADYTSALDEQGYIEGRINEIESILLNLVVITPKDNGKVSLGNQVEVTCEGKSTKYTVVGSLESDPAAGKISAESPIGQALLGAKIGDRVEISVPSGIRVCEIVKIS